jgi:7-cyano-7-deazaguanine synthase
MATGADWRTEPVAVLVSGGLDSAILLGELAQTSPRVYPVYVRFGLVWEAAEERSVRRFLAALHMPAVQPLEVFDIPLQPVYGPHWSVTGGGVPGYDSPDEAVFLPGRNLLLLSQAVVWCHLRGIPALALGILAGNPFPDSTDEYFSAFESLIETALGGKTRIVRPYRTLTKVDVLRRGRGLPLELTMSCIDPVEDRHCGRCNKCAERQHAFQEAGLPDPTQYA